MSRKLLAHYSDARGAYIEKPVVGILFAALTTVPADGSAGYAPGCIMIDENAAIGANFFINNGSVTSSDFDGLGGVSNPNLLSITTTNLIINDGSTDMDIRIESNALSAFFNIDSSELLNGELSIGAAVPTNPQAMFSLLPPANATGVTASQSYFHHQLLPGGATTIPAGTAPVVASMNIHEPNITATGTVTVAATVRIVDAPTEGSSNYALWVDSGVTRLDGNLEFSAALDIVGLANTAAMLEITDGTTALHAIDSRSTVSVITHTLTGPASQTLPNGATSRTRTISIPAKTVTLVGQTQVTTLNEGCQLEILAPTYNQSGGAVTVDKVSTLFVGTPVAGTSVTITTSHIIMTGTAGCFCTAAGTWTDTSSKKSKKNIRPADMEEVGKVLDQVEVVQFKKIEGSDGDYDRFGVIAEDVPDCMASKNKEGVASIYMAGFTLAAVKYLQAENSELRKRLEALEAKLAA